MVQLAFSRLVGKGKPLARREGGTYEAATTRRFLRGRTETIRVVTEETDEFCRSMNEGNASREERIELMRKAAAKHIALAKEAGMGQGVDRHLLGNFLPAKFTTPIF
jgi:carnitine O-acetyltransferase